MWFGVPHPFPEKGSATRLSKLGRQSFKGWLCRMVKWVNEWMNEWMN